jgi:hypothetical protein
MLGRRSGILAWRMWLPVDFPAKIKLAATLASGWDLRSRDKNPGYPPPPRVCRFITLARNSPQNPDDKELRGQNLDNKGLKRRRLALEQTVTASTIIADLIGGGKVRCHIGAVQNVRPCFGGAHFTAGKTMRVFWW